MGNRPPPVPAGWKSASQLKSEGFVGGSVIIDRKLRELRSRLIENAIKNGATEDRAVDHVEGAWIGIKSPAHGPSALYASPDALSMIGLRKHGEVSGPNAPDWQSGYKLARMFLHGQKTINRRLKELRSKLVFDIVAAGIDREVAESVVEDNLVKDSIVRFDCDPVTYGSRSAVRLLEDQGIIKRRRWDQPTERPPITR